MASEQAGIEVFNQGGEGPFVLTCEHATNEVPEEFGNLGLDDALLETHIAWDPGARPVAEALARLLDAPLIMPQVSRLVCDCNRPHGSAESMPDSSEIYDIPGNRDLTPGQRDAAFALMSASLSALGMQLSRDIMKLNHTLGEIQDGDGLGAGVDRAGMGIGEPVDPFARQTGFVGVHRRGSLSVGHIPLNRGLFGLVPRDAAPLRDIAEPARGASGP